MLGENKGNVQWWDRNDDPHDDGKIPYCDVDDDFDFLMEYGKVSIAKNPKTSVEVLKKLAKDKDKEIKRRASENLKNRRNEI